MIEKKLAGVLVLALVAACSVSPAPSVVSGSDLGNVRFTTSGHPDAQPTFARGVAALHSFEYKEAANLFRQAQEIDPDFAMAYWGEAMCHNAPIWNEQDIEEANLILGRLAPTPEMRIAKATLPEEKGLLRSLDLLFGEGDKLSRDLAYSRALGELYKRYPNAPDIAAFYALSLQGTLRPGRRDTRVQMRSAAIAHEVLSRYPDHPGAAHYLIHAVDDPIHASLGLRAARTYASIAPASEHALHMPSHIFLVLGMWDESVSSDEASEAAARAMVESGESTIAERHFHSLHWLSYTYPQQGAFRKAREAVAHVQSAAQQSGDRRTVAMARLIESMYIIQTGDWQKFSMPEPTDEGGFYAQVEAAQLLAAGLSAANTGDFASAAAAGERLEELGRRYQETGDTYRATYKEIMALEVTALARVRSGQNDAALELLDRAAKLEQSMDFPIIPPSIKPAAELFGEILIELGMSEEAVEQFEIALDRSPNRSLSVLGLARAAALGGDRTMACTNYLQFLKNWHGADPGLAELANARNAVRTLKCEELHLAERNG